MNPETYTCDMPAGTLSKEWSTKLGLHEDVIVGIGNTDAHSGAVGAGIKYKTLIQNIGTSTCNMAIMPQAEVGYKLIAGISGQVDGSIIPGMIGFEAGMSAFGDVYQWFKDILVAPALAIIKASDTLFEVDKKRLMKEVDKHMLATLTQGAKQINWSLSSPNATDWLNGRRNPFNNYNLKSTITNMTLSTTTYELFYALVEATAFGTKAIVDHFMQYDIAIDEIIATGGVALKSPFVMQVLADVLNKTISVCNSEQSCALGSAMFAAVLAGKYDRVEDAQKVIVSPANIKYNPDKSMNKLYSLRYEKYKELQVFAEASVGISM